MNKKGLKKKKKLFGVKTTYMLSIHQQTDPRRVSKMMWENRAGSRLLSCKNMLYGFPFKHKRE